MEAVPEITAAAAQAAGERGEVVLVDVREAPEWAAGRAPGAVHVPLSELEGRWPELERLDAPVAFLCRVGRRSALATVLASRRGMAAVNVAGGMHAWRAGGLPLDPPAGTIA